MKSFKIITFFALLFSINSFAQKSCKTKIIIKNTLNVERSFETVELTNFLLKVDDLTLIGIRDTKTKKLQITQTVDTDEDGIDDQILFQPIIPANSEKSYEIIFMTAQEKPQNLNSCYSRFVPERTDDYAWENNRVAFRTYGPIAQEMIEKNIAGGTLSSGIDAWLKRVDYPIINKWYKKHTSKIGTYHLDTGEGLDNFHVGNSRGIGGIAIKTDTSYIFSKNFKSWKTITTGPIRTSFILNYDTWDVNGKEIKESKHISLDFGSNLSKYTISIKGTDTISAGITLHKKDGVFTDNLNEGWLSYWEPLDDSEIGMGIVVPNGKMIAFEYYDTNKRDESNLYAHIKIKGDQAIYYAGFGWKKSLQFKNQKEWENYLSSFSKKLNNPLIIIYK